MALLAAAPVPAGRLSKESVPVCCEAESHTGCESALPEAPVCGETGPAPRTLFPDGGIPHAPTVATPTASASRPPAASRRSADAAHPPQAPSTATPSSCVRRATLPGPASSERTEAMPPPVDEDDSSAEDAFPPSAHSALARGPHQPTAWASMALSLGLAPSPLRRPQPERYKRDRVYNTLWGVPRRLEEMQAYSALLCVDALLATLVSLPLRTAAAAVRLLRSGGSARREATEQLLSDGVLVGIFGVTVWVLYRQDVGAIYHFIRSQEIVKLYVLFSVLEICDKLLCSFGADMLEALASSAASLAELPEGGTLGAFCLDVFLLTASVLAHSLVLLTQAITLSVAVNSHSNAALAVLISSNFQEVKGYVFKRMDAGKVGMLACQDAVERAHLTVHLLFMCAQHVEASRSVRAGLAAARLRAAAPAVLLCEPLIDVLKHAFMAKFNDIRPEVYGDVLRELAQRARRVQPHQAHLVLGFVPMAPAALLLRALPPAAQAVGCGGLWGAAGALLLLLMGKVATGVLSRRAAACILRAEHLQPREAHVERQGVPVLQAPPAGPHSRGAAATPRFYGAASPGRREQAHKRHGA